MDMITRVIAAFASGLCFAAGLGISGMTDPRAVLGFLTLDGAWSPQLALVMVGGIGTAAVGLRIARHRARPWLDGSFHPPTTRAIDAPLVVGASLFGVGWGLSGRCPGPALVAIPWGGAEVWVFVAAMAAGAGAANLWLARRAAGGDPPPQAAR
jgi:uncharacterized membrane protein YedE/YeeE